MIFASLRHRSRRDVIRNLSEREMTFSELQGAVRLSSPHLSYHLKRLRMLVVEEKGKYKLNAAGLAALDLMRRLDVAETPHAVQTVFLRPYDETNHHAIRTAVALQVVVIILAVSLLLASSQLVGIVEHVGGIGSIGNVSINVPPNETYRFTFIREYQNERPYRFSSSNERWLHAEPPPISKPDYFEIETLTFTLINMSSFYFAFRLHGDRGADLINFRQEWDCSIPYCGDHFWGASITSEDNYYLDIHNLGEEEYSGKMHVEFWRNEYERPYYVQGMLGECLVIVSVCVSVAVTVIWVVRNLEKS